jgi:lipopolysaccharide assembly protein A
MTFLKTLFWVVLAVVLVIFFMHNWTPTQINLFGDLVWQTKLPVPLMLAFLLGFVPVYAWHRAVRWRDRRRYAATVTATPAPVPASTTSPVPADPVVQTVPARGATPEEIE